jgi:hypothetical protein
MAAGHSGFAQASKSAVNEQAALKRARRLLAQFDSMIRKTDIVALIDFSQASSRPRFLLVDLETERVEAFLTAHGRGSDPDHTGMLQSFSNAPGSNATSRGAYRTLGAYEGKYGRSMRLEGLEPDNDNAIARAIVIHPAWYVSEAMIARYGKLGRSEGCFALSAGGLPAVLDRLGPGRLLYADRFDDLFA